MYIMEHIFLSCPETPQNSCRMSCDSVGYNFHILIRPIPPCVANLTIRRVLQGISGTVWQEFGADLKFKIC